MSGGGAPGAKKASDREYPTDLICNAKFRNTLPDIPFDPKIVRFPFDPLRFANYSLNTLEKYRQFSYHPTEPSYVEAELIDSKLYTHTDTDAALSPQDQALIEETQVAKTQPTKEGQRKAIFNTAVTFLKKTGVLSSGYTRYGAGSGSTPAAAAAAHSDALQGQSTGGPTGLTPNADSSIDDQSLQTSMDTLEHLAADIEESFQQATRQSYTHPTNPDLRPVSISPVLPNLDLQPHKLLQIIFNEQPPVHPYIALDSPSIASPQLSNSLLVGDTDPRTGEGYAEYYLPADPAQSQISIRQTQNVPQKLVRVQEFNYVAKSRYNSPSATKQYIITRTTGDGSYRFKQIDTLLTLKRRALQSIPSSKREVTHATIRFVAHDH